jgi:polyisoprenoid-binding protein YceI
LRAPARIFTGLLLAAALAAPAWAGTTIEGKPKVSFFATGSPGFMSIEGVSSAMTLEEKDGRLVFSVPMSTVDSGIALRDDHMNKNYVQIDQFPNVVLDLAKADVQWPAEGSASASAAANVTFHGVTQPTTVTYTVNKTKTGWRVKGRFEYDVSKHGITIEPYMGISFDHKMYATVTVDLVDAP